MEDPVKVVEQYRRYVSDGRLEIAEVMAQELSEMLLARKKRDLQLQRTLVDGLRDLASIYELRQKWKLSLAASGKLKGERRRLAQQLTKAGMRDEARELQKSIRAGDEVQRGRVLVELGKLRSAVSAFRSAAKRAPNNLEALIRQLEAHERIKGHLRGARKAARRLDTVLGQIGPVNRRGGEFLLCPEGEAVHPAELLVTDLNRWLDPALRLPASEAVALKGRADELRRQMEAIATGEQAADAALAAAVEKLEPVVDYHTYSAGGA